MKHLRIHLAALLGFTSVLLSLSAPAALYTFNFTDSGAIPQEGTVFSAEHAISGIASSITSVEMVLTFNDTSSLLGTAGGIQGHLNLGTTTSAPFVNFYPASTSSAGGHQVYDVTFSGSSGSPGTGFSGLNPNNTWGLVLWDNSPTHLENGLVGWSLNITAVPEPMNVALAVFGVVVAGVGGARWYLKRRHLQRRAYIWPL